MKAKKILGAALTSVGFVVGFAALTGATASIGTTGPDSINKIINKSSQELTVSNHNNLRVDNSNHQSASSGRAETEHNTTGGNATSGAASNANSLNVSATVNNAASSAALTGASNACGCGGSSSITNTGPDSKNIVVNKVSSEVEVTNTNNLSVDNHNTQTATTGSAEVSGNTTGGSATSGNASNTNSTSTTFNVSN